tara:strand:- start:122 stop:655 length:534 start_codon:yes stop_codon:yes gene_type:complete
MKHVFSKGEGLTVPDGTVVRSVLDSLVTQRAELSPIEDVSLAVGQIPPHTASRIHLHPVVTQVTWVISGNLKVKMKEAAVETPYELELQEQEAVVTNPYTFFQLINDSATPCETLYVVTPTFLFETDEAGQVIYNDAIVLEETWEELTARGWAMLAEDADNDWVTQRSRALERLRKV